MSEHPLMVPRPHKAGVWENSNEDEAVRQMLEGHIQDAWEAHGVDAVEFYDRMRRDQWLREELVLTFPSHLRFHVMEVLRGDRLREDFDDFWVREGGALWRERVKRADAAPALIGLLAAEGTARSALRDSYAVQSVELREAEGNWTELAATRARPPPGAGPPDSRLEQLVSDSEEQ